MNIPSRGSFSLTTPLLLGGLLLLGGCLLDEQASQATGAAELSGADAKNAQAFLQKYGYLEEAATGAALKGALLLYQQVNHLPADGALNPETLAEMARPRCDQPDRELVARHLGGDPSAGYVHGPSVWPNPGALSYRQVNYSTDLPQVQIDAVVTSAFAKWTHANTRLGITKLTGGAGGDILLSFQPQFHQHDGTPAEFGANTLAHSGYPVSDLSGDVHFNDALAWTAEGVGGQDLLASTLHELGHSLGLAHSSDPDSVMQPAHHGMHDLGADDILGIRTLYPPTAPHLTNINNACFGTNSLLWTESAGAIHYELFRSTSSSFTNPVLVSADSDTFEEVQVPSSGWWLRVKACWGPICSAYSNQVRANYFNGCM
jgi:Matrixin/Putative peptidoglycan binding domain